MSHRHVSVACADQDNTVFSAIPGYLGAAQGFAWLQPAALAAPEAGQPDAPKSADMHSNMTQSAGGDDVIPQSQCNHQRCCIGHCRKLSLGSVDSGIDVDLDAQPELWQHETDDDMCVGKVVPTLTMGHGRLPAQVLAEPAMPGAQFIQHMAPVPVLTHHPGDPPLEWEPANPPCHQLTAAQIER